jgi:hypothetical protein
MSISSAKSKIAAIEKSLAAAVEYPKSICKLKDGSITQIIGVSVVQPFLEGKFSEICCDDADIAYLLRAMDFDNKVKIELISLESGDKIKRVEI